jgi:hypothetical protein
MDVDHAALSINQRGIFADNYLPVYTTGYRVRQIGGVPLLNQIVQ